MSLLRLVIPGFQRPLPGLTAVEARALTVNAESVEQGSAIGAPEVSAISAPVETEAVTVESEPPQGM